MKKIETIKNLSVPANTSGVESDPKMLALMSCVLVVNVLLSMESLRRYIEYRRIVKSQFFHLRIGKKPNYRLMKHYGDTNGLRHESIVK